MLFVICLFLGTFNGVFGDKKGCKEFNPLRVCNLKISEVQIPLHNQGLTKFCTRMEEFYGCYDGKVDENELYGTCGGRVSKFIVSARELFGDLCNTSSSFHADYFNNLPCFKTLEDQFLLCDKKSDILYRKYVGHLKSKNPGSGEPAATLKKCVKVLHKMICIDRRVLKQCGNNADRTFADLVQRTNFFYMYCSIGDFEEGMNIVKLVMSFDSLEQTTVVTLKNVISWLESQY